jgi:hypothetical protein
MTHVHNDELLLLAYGELRETDHQRVQAHLAGCESCRTELVRLETSRVALDLAVPTAAARPRRSVRWIAAGLAAAALVAAVILVDAPGRPETPNWRPTSSWSATAGYVTGGSAMAEIDAQLTRLEQERSYGLPN